MTGALVTTAALMGLAGAAHCAGMCSAACHAVGRACVPGAPRRGVGMLLAARLLAYAAAGVAVGLVAQALRWWLDSSAWLQPLWTIAQVVLGGLGLWLVLRGELPPSLQLWAERLRRPRAAQVHKVHLPGELKAATLGLLWPVLPCGLLHAVLALAVLASGPAEAAGMMAAFALTSSLGLVAGGLLWRRIGNGSLAGGAGAIRLAGAGIMLLSLWPLVQHVWVPLQTAWCG